MTALFVALNLALLGFAIWLWQNMRLHRRVSDELVAASNEALDLLSNDTAYGPYTVWYERTERFIEELFGPGERVLFSDVGVTEQRPMPFAKDRTYTVHPEVGDICLATQLRSLVKLRDSVPKKLRKGRQGVERAIAERHRPLSAAEKIVLAPYDATEALLPPEFVTAWAEGTYSASSPDAVGVTTRAASSS